MLHATHEDLLWCSLDKLALYLRLTRPPERLRFCKGLVGTRLQRCYISAARSKEQLSPSRVAKEVSFQSPLLSNFLLPNESCRTRLRHHGRGNQYLQQGASRFEVGVGISSNWTRMCTCQWNACPVLCRKTFKPNKHQS